MTTVLGSSLIESLKVIALHPAGWRHR